MDTAIQSTPSPATPVPAKRRFRWRALGVGALVLLALPVTYYFVSAWFADRSLQRICAEIEAEDPHWQWADLLAQTPPAPEDVNAFTQIRKVNGLLKKTPFAIAPIWDTPAKEKARQVRNARLSEDNVTLLRAAFAPLDPMLLKEARKLKDYPKGRMKIDPATNPFELMLGDIQSSRSLMHVLDNDILLRTHDNDIDGAVESWQALLNTSHAIEDNPTLIGQLVRIAGQTIALAALERMLGQDELSEPDLAKIQALLHREMGDNLLYFGLRGERAGGHRLYTDLRDGKITLSKVMSGINMGQTGVLDHAVDLFPSIILKGYPEHLRLLDEQVKASKLKDDECLEAMKALDDKVRNSRNIITRLLMPATNKVAEANHRSQAQLRCALVAVAVERYRIKNDAWPQGFDDLLKDRWLDEVPKDPYDGKPLRFKRTPTGIVIYSVGLDKIDNQGKLDRGNPLATGADRGIELWDRKLRAIAPPVEDEM